MEPHPYKAPKGEVLRAPPMRFRLRTLLIVLGLLPPVLWGLYLFFRVPGSIHAAVEVLLALLTCLPWAILRLAMDRPGTSMFDKK